MSRVEVWNALVLGKEEKLMHKLMVGKIWIAGIYASHRARTPTPVAPMLALAPAEVPLETISDPREIK